MTEPKHIRPAWQRVAARMQHEARLAVNREAQAIISIKILVDTCGNAVRWTNPSIVFLEPKPRPGTDCIEDLEGVDLDLLT